MAILHEIKQRAPGDRMLEMIRVKYPDYHPVMAIADLAHQTENEELEFKCHQAVAKYVAPELKSIEVRAEVTQQRRVVVELFDEATIKPRDIPTLNLDRPESDDVSYVDAKQSIRSAVSVELMRDDDYER